MRHLIKDAGGRFEERYQCVNCGKTFTKIPDPEMDKCDGPFIVRPSEPTAF